MSPVADQTVSSSQHHCLCRRPRIRLSLRRNTAAICASFLVSDLGSCQQWRGVYSVGRLRTCDSHSGGSVPADSVPGLGPRKSLDPRIKPRTLFTRGEIRSGWSTDGAAGQRIIICRIVAEEFSAILGRTIILDMQTFIRSANPQLSPSCMWLLQKSRLINVLLVLVGACCDVITRIHVAALRNRTDLGSNLYWNIGGDFPKQRQRGRHNYDRTGESIVHY